MDIEHSDVLKASTFTIKFMQFKTPSAITPETPPLPAKLFFTMKFYTFPASQTESVELKDPVDSDTDRQIKLAT